MKIIFLNAWYGKMGDALAAFLKEQAVDTDIFCFQEISEPCEVLVDGVLLNYQKTIGTKTVTADDDFSLAMYIRPGITISESGTILREEPNVGLGLYMSIPFEASSITIVNLHGMSRPIEKRDDPGRLKQSQELLSFLKKRAEPAVLGGDFNLFPDTQSLEMIRSAGYQDLIKEYNIPTTRNRLAWIYPEKHLFADYIFLDRRILLKSFSVPNIEISDHLPLILTI